MDPEVVVKQFRSTDAHQMWMAAWSILQCNDADKVKTLKPYLPEFRKICHEINMGGAFRSNNESAELSFICVENAFRGICRCKIYSQQNILDPRRETDQGFITILWSELLKEKYEEHFRVQCKRCDDILNVREIAGGHVPWFVWRAA